MPANAKHGTISPCFNFAMDNVIHTDARKDTSALKNHLVCRRGSPEISEVTACNGEGGTSRSTATAGAGLQHAEGCDCHRFGAPERRGPALCSLFFLFLLQLPVEFLPGGGVLSSQPSAFNQALQPHMNELLANAPVVCTVSRGGIDAWPGGWLDYPVPLATYKARSQD